MVEGLVKSYLTIVKETLHNPVRRMLGVSCP